MSKSDNNNNANNDLNQNTTNETTSLLAVALNDNKLMSNDLKELLNKKFIKEIAFYHIIHDLKEDKNYLLSSDGPLCKKFVSLNTKDMTQLPVLHPIRKADTSEATTYFKEIWEMGMNGTDKGIQNSLSVKKTSIYATITDSFKSK